MLGLAGQVGLIHLFLHLQSDGGDDVLVLAVINVLRGFGYNFLVIFVLFSDLHILGIQPLDSGRRFTPQHLAGDLNLTLLHHLHRLPVDDDGRPGLHLDGDRGQAGLDRWKSRSRPYLTPEPQQDNLAGQSDD